jgi:hypothetical protein
VVVAVVSVPMVQPSVHQVVLMVPVRDFLVVTLIVTAGALYGRAGVRVRSAHLDNMLIVMVTVLRVKMTVMQIVYVAAVHDSGVTTGLPMDMAVVLVDGAAHNISLGANASC